MEIEQSLSPIRLLSTILHHLLLLIRIVLDYVSDLFFGLYYTTFHPRVRLPPPQSTILLESATFLAKKIRAREVTSLAVLDEYITRIRAINPIINAVVAERFEKAREEAIAVDLILDGQKPLSAQFSEENKPFFGVPFTCKEAVRVSGLPNTSGLYLRNGFLAKDDADVIKLMRNSGAIPLAVTNVSEICMWWESSNKIYGQSRNPYNTTRTVGGSSGGEAALLAAGGSAFGVGSDIGGSIRMPAFFNGIFGHKPTYGLVSNLGQFPDAQGNLSKFLVTGPMCRVAEDLIPMFKVLLGEKAKKLNLDTPVDLSRVKIHFALDDGGYALISPVQASIKTALLQAVRHLENTCGAEIKTFEKIKPLEYSFDIWTAMMGKESVRTFAEEMANREGRVNPYLETVKWFLGQSPHTLPAVLFGLSESIFSHFPNRQSHYITMCQELETRFTSLLGQDGVFIYPTHPRTAPYHHQPLLMPFNFSYTGIINVMGLPSTHVPLGLDGNGLPLGVQIIANHYNDRLCLAVAKELERAFGGWVCP